jgi:hypothetical protein
MPSRSGYGSDRGTRNDRDRGDRPRRDSGYRR